MQKKRAIASARAFLNAPRFDLIVEILKLNPEEDWTKWQDIEGNQLKISKNKAIHVYHSKQESEYTNDVYRKAKPVNIAKHSYWVLALFGSTQSILSFIGNDGTLRCCYFENNIWKCNLPPIMLGYQILGYIASGYIETESRKIAIPIIGYPKRFKIEEAWASGYPVADTNLKERIQCHLMTNQSLPE
jgi:hypothetical protein